ncbi:MAG TPA: glycogen/starch/alpha-glucan phosphorylase [Clostridia bacterium]|nr:glycogen/starch/alpha-glucan phosphorylase [Clostridia bacterium]
MVNTMERISLSTFGKGLSGCNDKEKYVVVSKAIMENIIPKWVVSEKKFEGKKKAYYLSAEYLMGRSLTNNLINMKRKSEVKSVLEDLGICYNRIEEQEEDAALGNGGLGRLGACFLDSASALDYPLTGYGIRYEFGLFKQLFKDGFQVEVGDDWLEYPDPWSIRKQSESVRVSFADGDVLAVPYDTPIIGYGQNTINTLRLWKSEPFEKFNFKEFDNQNYELSVEEKNSAENITKVLYPNDAYKEGRELRLKQQYFFVSASLQDLIRKHKAKYDTLDNFAQFHAIQLNDTHPAVAIPELMRLFTEVEGMEWGKAWDIVTNVFAYTNHTLLAEALEQWFVGFYKTLIPSVFRIVERIDHQLMEKLSHKDLQGCELDYYRIINHDHIKMAWLAIYGSKSVNGVSELHSNILKYRELNNWYRLSPEKFNNKTNGITQRRWLLKSNPELSNLITELLDSEDWITDLERLKDLEKFADDKDVLSRFLEIKHIGKKRLADYMFEKEGIKTDPNSIFDIQIKRLHEYKRQLLNAFHILDFYFRIKANPQLDIVPRTFIFGAKAAPGYVRAKGIIKYINDIKQLVNNDPEVSEKIKVVFVENYNVSYAEKLFPAADVSEQIPTAGKEASGTGNMKFMLNGVPTIGTYDGANIEIVKEAGEENNFIFGLRVEDIEKIAPSYNPVHEYETVEGLKRVVDTLVDGTFSDAGTGVYGEIYNSLLNGTDWHRSDVFYVLKDFESYRNAQQDLNDAFKDRMGWAKKCWMNLSNAGRFSSDRTIDQYAKEIWGIEKA